MRMKEESKRASLKLNIKNKKKKNKKKNTKIMASGPIALQQREGE